MTDAEMMQMIHAELGDYIAGACEGTAIAPAFVAALVANESGGNVRATRFEPTVMGSLARVIAGQLSEYAPAGIKAPIGAQDLKDYCNPQRQLSSTGPIESLNSFSQSLVTLINLSTSWGPTQIMGWHALEFGFPMSDLTNIGMHFERAVQLLEAFTAKYPATFDPAQILRATDGPTGSAALFRCWNAGSPTGKTFDPNYVVNGLARMALYAAIGN